MIPLVIIKDIEFNNTLLTTLQLPKILCENSYEDIKEKIKNTNRVIITWNSTTILDISLVNKLLEYNGEIVFIANLPEYMEFEIWNTEFLLEVLEKHKNTAKPLRNLLSSIELDEAIYYTDIIENDIRLFRWELTPYSYKAEKLLEKVIPSIDTSNSITDQLQIIFRQNPEYLTEIPTFYYLEISSEYIESKYLPKWNTQPHSMTKEEFINTINIIKDYSKTFGVMLGLFNEPLLNKHIEEILHTIKNFIGEKISFIINTSLNTLPQSLIDLFRETKGLKGFKNYPFLSIFVDIPSHKKELFSQLKECNYDEVMNNLSKLLYEDTSRVYIKFVRSIFNTNTLPDFYNHFKGSNVIITRPFSKEIIAVDTVLSHRIPCYKLQTSLVILPNGDVLLCPEDTEKKYILGNIFNTSLKEITTKKSKILKMHFDNNFEDICKDCPIWDQFDL